MLPRTSNLVFAAAILSACCVAKATYGQGNPNNWIPAGVGDYASNGNWNAGSVPQRDTFEERAVISNGGTAILSVGTVPVVGGVDVTNGTLQIDRGGALVTGVGASANGTLTIGTTGSLVMGGLVGSGAASFEVVGAATMQGNTSLIGPNVNFSAASFTLPGKLTTTITLGGSSPLKTAGTAALSGPLELVFSGVTPAVGNFWDVIDASSITGGFSQITTSSTLGPGLFLIYNKVGGGINGQVGRVSVDAKLILSVNRQTGATSIRNLTSSQSVLIDGYQVGSPSGVLNVPQWTSFNDGGFSSFRESNPTANHIGELSLTGSRSIGPNSTTNLGNIFTGTVPPLTVTPGGDLTFDYHVAGGTTQTGIVDYTGPHNNLVLVVNPDGHTYIQNQSSVALNIDGYTITSASGAVNLAGWTSLADGNAAWRESNPSNNQLSELNLTSNLSLAAQSAAVSLGTAFDVGGAKDLIFLYHRAGLGTLTGTVEYEDGVITFSSIPGDYDKNGIVQAADYTKWRQLFGTVGPSDADGNGDNIVNAADYVIWRNNLGPGVGSALGQATAVPEPGACVVCFAAFIAILALSSFRRKSERRGPQHELGRSFA